MRIAGMSAAVAYLHREQLAQPQRTQNLPEMLKAPVPVGAIGPVGVDVEGLLMQNLQLKQVQAWPISQAERYS